jgi:3-phosphoshikimate 1-carboxyvinyltransferase
MSSSRSIRPATAIRGRLVIPGDKSISHRALLLAAVSDGASTIRGRAAGEDQDSMVRCLGALGVAIETEGDRTLLTGVGLRGLGSPAGELDCGNSGATMRFLTGILAGIEGVEAVLTGDASLSSRPMARVADPLRRMGAEIGTSPAGLPPVVVSGRHLHGADHHLAIGSAQVKTAILLAGLNAEGQTYIIGRDTGRDHTERMLRQLGVDIESADAIRLRPPDSIPAFQLTVPGDPSSAAFWIVLGAVHPDAEVSVTGVCVNPTRTGFLEVLRRMGAQIRLSEEAASRGEPTATVTAVSSNLHATDIDPTEVPGLLDEIPILSVAAACAEGTSRFVGLSELRLKEVDRVDAVAGELSRMGAEIEVVGDDLVITGGRGLRGSMVNSRGDHRLAMSLAIAATVAHGPSELAGAGAAAVSYPDFFDTLSRLAVR